MYSEGGSQAPWSIWLALGKTGEADDTGLWCLSTSLQCYLLHLAASLSLEASVSVRRPWHSRAPTGAPSSLACPGPHVGHFWVGSCLEFSVVIAADCVMSTT